MVYTFFFDLYRSFSGYFSRFADRVSTWLASLQSEETRNKKIAEKVEALHRACKDGDLNAVQTLLAGADAASFINGEVNGETPLYQACMQANMPILEALLNHPALDVNHRNAKSQTALYGAARAGLVGVVKRLLCCPRIDPSIRGMDLQNSRSALANRMAGEAGLETAPVPVFRTALGIARCCKRQNVVLCFAKESPAVREVLTEALTHDDQEMFTTCFENPNLTSEQINKPISMSGEQMTPLMEALYRRRPAMVEMLLKDSRVNVNHCDPQRGNICSWALFVCGNNIETLGIILADPRIDIENVKTDGVEDANLALLTLVCGFRGKSLPQEAYRRFSLLSTMSFDEIETALLDQFDAIEGFRGVYGKIQFAQFDNPSAKIGKVRMEEGLRNRSQQQGRGIND